MNKLARHKAKPAITTESTKEFQQGVSQGNQLLIARYPSIFEPVQGDFSCHVCIGKGIIQALKQIPICNINGNPIFYCRPTYRCPECDGVGVTEENIAVLKQHWREH